MTQVKLSDREAKNILRKWPDVTKELFIPPTDQSVWFRAAPKSDRADGHDRILPKIHTLGSMRQLTTHPDGLYIALSFDKNDKKEEEFPYVDVISIEVCGTTQNLSDKRSRYAGLGTSIVLRFRKGWLQQSVVLEKGLVRSRWQILGLPSEPHDHLQVPIRFMRVLYALPDNEYFKLRDVLVPGGHEYYCSHSSLETQNSPQMKKFLKNLNIHSHFHTL